MTRVFAGIAVALALLALDMRHAPRDQLSTRAAVSVVHLYQATLSKWYARIGVQCRFTPTCSHYAEATLERLGTVRGGWMSLKRVLRCGPWTPLGTPDPPPT